MAQDRLGDAFPHKCCKMLQGDTVKNTEMVGVSKLNAVAVLQLRNLPHKRAAWLLESTRQPLCPACLQGSERSLQARVAGLQMHLLLRGCLSLQHVRELMLSRLQNDNA